MKSYIDKADLEAYLQTRVAIRNTSGGRGFDHGVRIFDCPWCEDEGARGWMNVELGTAGCFNAGCPAHARVDGGALEWIRGFEGFVTRGKTAAYLRAEFPKRGVTLKPTPPQKYNDFCRFPEGSRLFRVDEDPIIREGYVRFAKTQWGLTLQDLVNAGARWCPPPGKYTGRLVFPIFIDSRPVGFQARAIGRYAKAKYLTSTYVGTEDEPAECGRPAEAMLYGIDLVMAQSDVVLVEGIGDVLAYNKRRDAMAVGLLGTHLTSEKIAMLRKRNPRRIIVALDVEPETRAAALEAVKTLLAWDVNAVLGTWQGGKDAGSGARLDFEGLGLSASVVQRLWRK